MPESDRFNNDAANVDARIAVCIYVEFYVLKFSYLISPFSGGHVPNRSLVGFVFFFAVNFLHQYARKW